MDKSHIHNCDSCATFRFNSYPARPSKISNNRFFRNFPPPCNFSMDMPISIQPDPLRKFAPFAKFLNVFALVPAGTNPIRPKRNNKKLIGKKTAPLKKIQRNIKSPSPSPIPSLFESMPLEASPINLVESFEKPISVVSNLSFNASKQGDCDCENLNFEPSQLLIHTYNNNNHKLHFSLANSFVEGAQSSIGDGPSTCSMSKSSNKNMSNYLYDNQALKETSCKKQSACAEILDCLDEDSEVWILQCPRCFDIKKILNSELKTGNGTKLDVCHDRFKSSAAMICLTPEKAAEYQSVCDEIKLVRPVGKIMVTEAQADSCSEEDPLDEECTSNNLKAVDSIPLTCKKVQKKVNDQRFTIETTVTVENVCAKKQKKPSIKQESCLPLVPPEPVPMKKKKKNY